VTRGLVGLFGGSSSFSIIFGSLRLLGFTSAAALPTTVEVQTAEKDERQPEIHKESASLTSLKEYNQELANSKQLTQVLC
jgi:hypothetical protein